MERKLQKYVDIMLQDADAYNVSMLLVPPTVGKPDYRWSRPHSLWSNLPADPAEAKAAIQVRCEKSFIDLYTTRYHEQGISRQEATPTSSFDINCHIETIARQLSPKKNVCILTICSNYCTNQI
jgi:hypothetical protein